MNLSPTLSHSLPAARRAESVPVLGRPGVAANLAAALAVACGMALLLAESPDALSPLAGQELLGGALTLVGLRFFLWRDELRVDERQRLYHRRRDFACCGAEQEGALREARFRLRTARDWDGFGVYYVLELQFPDAPPLLLGHYSTRSAARAEAAHLAERYGLRDLSAKFEEER